MLLPIHAGRYIKINTMKSVLTCHPQLVNVIGLQKVGCNDATNVRVRCQYWYDHYCIPIRNKHSSNHLKRFDPMRLFIILLAFVGTSVAFTPSSKITPSKSVSVC